MTYCLAIKVNEGIVFCSDSRTNAGVDQVSTYSKLYSFGIPGERQFSILNSGNLATTQAVIAKVKSDIEKKEKLNIMNASSIRALADYLGQLNRQEIEKQSPDDASKYDATFIVGGQIGLEHEPKIFLVYPEGNHISSSHDTPFLQIGESKYGKPILDRVLSRETDLMTAASAALVSMDSTMRSNLSVGPPLEVSIYHTNSLEPGKYFKFDEDSEYLRIVKKEWDNRLREAFKQMPPIVWGASWDQSPDEQTSVS